MLIYPDEMALIKGHPYFAHIENDADIKWFLQCMDAKLETVEAGTALCREGEKSEFVPVVLKAPGSRSKAKAVYRIPSSRSFRRSR